MRHILKYIKSYIDTLKRNKRRFITDIITEDTAFVFEQIFNAVFFIRINPNFLLAILTIEPIETIELNQITVIGLMISLTNDVTM